MAKKLYTVPELVGILPKVTVNGIDFILSGSSTKSISSPVEVSYVNAGNKLVLTEKRIQRVISVNNAQFVNGDPYTLNVGDTVNVDGITGILQSISEKGFSVKEILPTGEL